MISEEILKDIEEAISNGYIIEIRPENNGKEVAFIKYRAQQRTLIYKIPAV